MKEPMLTVIWKINPLEEEHFSGMTYALCMGSTQPQVCSLLLQEAEVTSEWHRGVVLPVTPHQQNAHLKTSNFSLCNFC